MDLECQLNGFQVLLFQSSRGRVTSGTAAAIEL